MPLALEQFGENAGKPPVRLLLKNEIGIEDAQIPEGKAGYYRLLPDDLSLHANIELKLPKINDGRYKFCKERLQRFLNKGIEGPFFVHPERIENDQKTGYFPITILRVSDIGKIYDFFLRNSHVVDSLARYEGAFDKNAQLLAKWQDKGVKLHNHALYKYAKPKVS